MAPFFTVSRVQSKGNHATPFTPAHCMYSDAHTNFMPLWVVGGDVEQKLHCKHTCSSTPKYCVNTNNINMNSLQRFPPELPCIL